MRDNKLNVKNKMKHKFVSFGIITLLFLACFAGMMQVTQAPALDLGTGTIRGDVNDSSNGNPIEGATITINRTDTPQQPQSVSTNETGFYIFDENVTNGTYDIIFYKDGYDSCEVNNNSVYANQSMWVNTSLHSSGGGGDDFMNLDQWQSSVSPAYLYNNTQRKFNFSVKIYSGHDSKLTNITIDLPTNFTYIGNNGTSLSDTDNYAVYNTSDKIVWQKTNEEGFSFSELSYFWFNVSSNDSLGSADFTCTIVYGDDNSSQSITFSVFTVTSFYHTGSIKDIEGNALPGGVASVTVQSFGHNSAPTTLGTFNDTANETGHYNVTDIPTLVNVSEIEQGGSMGPGGDNDQLFYQLSAAQYNDSSNTYATNISASLPNVPLTEFINMLDNPEIYLRPAIAFQVNVTGPFHIWDEVNHTIQITYGLKNFSMMVKDLKLGYSVKELNTQNNQKIFSVPKGRNYSFNIFADESFPISIRFNNISATCEADGNFSITGVNTSCISYNNTYLIKVELNASSINAPLNGSFTGVNDPYNMRVVAYTMEDRDMVFENWALPYNLGNESGDGNEDIYDTEHLTYNITLPATQAPSYLMLRAFAQNASGYYMGSSMLSAEGGELSNDSINFAMEPLIQGTSRSISSSNVSDDWNQTSIVDTTAVLFQLVNSTGVNLSNENPFVEIKRELNGQTYKQMTDGSNGVFNISLVEGESIKKLTIYSQQYAPISTSVSTAVLNGSTNTSTLDFSNGTCRVTMTSFGEFDPLGENADIRMQMFTSNASCNVPNPPDYCNLCGDDEGDGMDKSSFSPFNAILKGDISMMIKTNSSNGWIFVYYLTVDLLASGPPDAAFSTDASESNGGLAAAWQFGSQGPDIYDSVLIGIPMTDNQTNSTVKIAIPLLYDNDFNVIWNASEGNTVDDIRNDSTLNTLYGDYLDTEYEAYLNGTGVICSASDPTLSSGLGYKDTTNGTLWIKIPHFSAIGPEVIQLPDAPTGFSASASSSSAISLSWTKDDKADNTIVVRKTGSYPTSRSDGTEVYNSTGSSTSDSGLSASTTYKYSAWSWNSTSSEYSSNYSTASAQTNAGSNPIIPSSVDDDEEEETANLTAEAGGPYTGVVNSAVQFSGSASDGTSPYSYSWNFGDGNTSTQQNPTHTYDTAETYTATLTVTDSDSTTATDTATVTISEVQTDDDAPTISSLYHSPTTVDSEDTVTVYAQVTDDYNVTSVVLYWNDTSIENTSSMTLSDSLYTKTIGPFSLGTTITYWVVATDNASQTTTSTTNTFTVVKINVVQPDTEEKELGVDNIQVLSKSDLQNISVDILEINEEEVSESEKPTLAENEVVFKYLQINLTADGLAINDDEIDKITISFKVTKQWISDNNIDPTTIILMRYHDGEWEKLTTSMNAEDDTYVYFDAIVNGTSTFVVSGSQKDETTTTTSTGVPWYITAGIIIVIIIVVFLAVMFKAGFLYVEEVKDKKKRK